MPVPTSFADLDTTASLNSPQNSESPKGVLDDYLRSHAALIKQNYVTAAAATSTASAAVAKSGDTMTGNLDFSGNSLRIRGDFSNATVANMTTFQSSTVNGGTTVRAIPNGTSTFAGLSAATAEENGSFLAISINGAAGSATINSSRDGTGTYLPVRVNVGGAERMRIDTSGNVGVGAVPRSDWDSTVRVVEGINNHSVIFGTVSNALLSNIYTDGVSYKYITDNFAAQIAINKSTGTCSMLSYPNRAPGTTATPSGVFQLAANGNATLTTPNGGLGYGVGAGGTVTQATSKSTAVTLNKPSGKVTMHNASLAAGASAIFNITNSVMQTGDVATVTIDGPSVSNAWLYRLEAVCGIPGTIGIRLTNTSGGAVAEAVAFDFQIHKGARA